MAWAKRLNIYRNARDAYDVYVKNNVLLIACLKIYTKNMLLYYAYINWFFIILNSNLMLILIKMSVI